MPFYKNLLSLNRRVEAVSAVMDFAPGDQVILHDIRPKHRSRNLPDQSQLRSGVMKFALRTIAKAISALSGSLEELRTVRRGGEVQGQTLEG